MSWFLMGLVIKKLETTLGQIFISWLIKREDRSDLLSFGPFKRKHGILLFFVYMYLMSR